MQFGEDIDTLINSLETEPNIAVYWQKATFDGLLKDPCNFNIVPNFNFKKPLSFFLSKNSPYRDLFDYQ